MVSLASVLVVEEHDEMRAALRDWLLNALPPFKLREARSMEEALRHAEETGLDLALINMELPGLDGRNAGISAARSLRQRWPRCSVIILSAFDSEPLRLAALDAGADAFICKREVPTGLLPTLIRLLRVKV